MNLRKFIWLLVFSIMFAVGFICARVDVVASKVKSAPLFVSYARVADSGRVDFGWSAVPCPNDPPTVGDLNRIGGELYAASPKAGNLIILNFRRVQP